MPLALELVRNDDNYWIAEAANDFWRRGVAADDLDAALAGHLESPAGTRRNAVAKLLKRHLSQSRWRVPNGRWALERGAALDGEALAAAHAVARAVWQVSRDEIADLVQRALHCRALRGVSYKTDWVTTAVASWDDLLRGEDAMHGLDEGGAKSSTCWAQQKLADARTQRIRRPRRTSSSISRSNCSTCAPRPARRWPAGAWRSCVACSPKARRPSATPSAASA